MNNILNKIIIFTAGAAIGSIATWKILKTKYEQLIEEEISSVKDAYTKVYNNSKTKVEDEIKSEELETENQEINEYIKIANKYNNEEEDNDFMDMPYLISPEEYADSDYEAASLWYFADGVLTDEQYNVIEDIEETIGEDALQHFGEYEDDPDTVYVRNDYLEVDYEICRDERKYSEI